jgi:hypothetical protein
MNFTDVQLQQVALMHDLIEDTPVTLEQLSELGFSQPVVQTIGLLTRQPQVSYADYIRRIKSHDWARQVKLADLRDNSALNRALYRSSSAQRDLQRLGRYILSYQFLEDRITESDYLQRMALLD